MLDPNGRIYSELYALSSSTLANRIDGGLESQGRRFVDYNYNRFTPSYWKWRGGLIASCDSQKSAVAFSATGLTFSREQSRTSK